MPLAGLDSLHFIIVNSFFSGCSSSSHSVSHFGGSGTDGEVEIVGAKKRREIERMQMNSRS